MFLNNKFKLGDVVGLRVDDSDDQAMITKISICIDNGILYELSWGRAMSTEHYEKELILKEPDESLSI